MVKRKASTAVAPKPFVTRITVEKLFGEYSYEIALKGGTDASHLFILYGENGCGKTTLLWLLYHLLSTENGRGHKSFVARTRFKKLEIEFSSGHIVTAERKRSMVGSFDASVSGVNEPKTFRYEASSEQTIPAEVGQDKNQNALLSQFPVIDLSILPDDRKITQDIVPEETAKTVYLKTVWEQMLHPDAAARRTAAENALTKVLEWVREQALKGSNVGQVNVNAIYSEIIQRVSKAGRPKGAAAALRTRDLVKVLNEQSSKTREYSRFGLMSQLDVEKLIESIRSVRPDNLQIVTQVLEPFIEGNDARLKALEPLQRSITSFVDSLNNFYINKQISFHTRDGIKILSREGETLDPRVLSSGERQLLILFCSAIQTTDKPRLFIIDEPELSLNVTWQRDLIDALIRCTERGAVQFILATHSLELLARHRKNVARLKNLQSKSKPHPPTLSLASTATEA
jgi:energy-coupling factor transporter ATP-binding protein EcfA2